MFLLIYYRSEHDISPQDGVDDTVTSVVECVTSQGNLTIDVRSGWAPLGSIQYLNLISQNFFTDLPFFRVCPRYITQFGAKYQSQINVKVIKDDRTLWGVRDMDYGYVFFAGSGKDSRREEMVLALCDMKVLLLCLYIIGRNVGNLSILPTGL